MTSEEDFVFKKFLEYYPKYSNGVKTETPDYIIELNSRRIGVEITEIVKENGQKFSPAQHQSIEDKIVNTASNEFKKLSDIRAHVVMSFQPELNLNSKDIILLGRWLDDQVHQATKHLSKNEIFYNGEISRPLPKELIHLSFDIAPYLDETYWCPVRYLHPFTLDSKTVNEVIIKKEELYDSYMVNIESIILLMAEGLSARSSFSDYNVKGVIDTRFDKVFLYRGMKNKLYELK